MVTAASGMCGDRHLQGMVCRPPSKVMADLATLLLRPICKTISGKSPDSLSMKVSLTPEQREQLLSLLDSQPAVEGIAFNTAIVTIAPKGVVTASNRKPPLAGWRLDHPLSPGFR